MFWGRVEFEDSWQVQVQESSEVASPPKPLVILFSPEFGEAIGYPPAA